jgi:sterol 3beta-glucosyltransferase
MSVLHVVLVTLGSLGDVLPKVAIAEALSRKGAAATIVTYDTYAPLIRRAGAGFRAVPGDPRALLTKASDRLAMTAAERNIAAYARTLEAEIERRRERAFLVLDAAHSAYVAPTCWSTESPRSSPPRAAKLWDARRAPRSPSRSRRPTVSPPSSHRSTAVTARRSRRLATGAPSDFWGRLARHCSNEWRTIRLGLPALGPQGPLVALDKARAPILYGFSPHLIPPDPAWPPQIEGTGAWRAIAMASDPLPKALEAFFGGRTSAGRDRFFLNGSG